MKPEFWHNAWKKSDQPGWQQKNVNQHLLNRWSESGASDSEVVFVPLCGRSLDMQWLRESGHHVIGIDLSVTALEQFCEQQSIDATCERDGLLTVFRASGWTLFAGDFFRLEPDQLSRVSRVYDRAALIALPETMREDYARHLQRLLPAGAEIFAITITYDQTQMDGPPFSVSDSEFRELYGAHYDIRVLQSESGPVQVGNLADRGLTTLCETSYLLRPKAVPET